MKKVLALIAAASVLPVCLAIFGDAREYPANTPAAAGQYNNFIVSREMAHPALAKYTKDEFVSDYIYDLYTEKIDNAANESEAALWRHRLDSEREIIRRQREIAGIAPETLASMSTDMLIETALQYPRFPLTYAYNDPKLALSALTDIGLFNELFLRSDAQAKLEDAYAAAINDGPHPEDPFRADHLRLLLEKLKSTNSGTD